jgi:hypothetical protein
VVVRRALYQGCVPLLALVTAACVSDRSASDLLPFHVAVLPVTVSASQLQEPSSGAIQLTMHPDTVRASLVESLAERCFVEVSATGPALAGERGDASLQPHIRDALTRGADLLLQCSVEYEPLVRTELNEKFWLTLPFFLFGGPFIYCVDDRSYTANVRIRASLHDLQPILAGRASLEDGRAECLYIETQVSETTLDFLDRAGDFSLYLRSMLIPVGLLAKQGPKVERALGEHKAEDLARALAEELLTGTDSLSGSSRVAAFFLAKDLAVQATRGETTLQGRVLVRRGSPSRLSWCRAISGDTVTTVQFGSPRATPPGARYDEFDLELQLAASGRSVRLEIASGGRDPQVRSYTIRVPPSSESR